MYSILAQGDTGTAVEIHGPKSLSAAFDYAMAFVRNPKKFHSGRTKTMRLVNVATGKVLKVWDVNQETVSPLPEIKLTEAMTRALFSEENPLVGLPGASNTLRALETRGLVKLDNVGVARLTSLGRRYRAQKKGA